MPFVPRRRDTRALLCRISNIDGFKGTRLNLKRIRGRQTADDNTEYRSARCRSSAPRRHCVETLKGNAVVDLLPALFLKHVPSLSARDAGAP